MYCQGTALQSNALVEKGKLSYFICKRSNSNNASPTYKIQWWSFMHRGKSAFYHHHKRIFFIFLSFPTYEMETTKNYVKLHEKSFRLYFLIFRIIAAVLAILLPLLLKRKKKFFISLCICVRKERAGENTTQKSMVIQADFKYIFIFHFIVACFFMLYIWSLLKGWCIFIKSRPSPALADFCPKKVFL